MVSKTKAEQMAAAPSPATAPSSQLLALKDRTSPRMISMMPR